MAGYHTIDLGNDNKITISSDSELIYNDECVGKFFKSAKIMIEDNTYHVLVGQDTTTPSIFLDADNAIKVYGLYGKVRELMDEPVKNMYLACVIKKVENVYVGIVLGLYEEHQKAKSKLVGHRLELDGGKKVICKC